MHTHNYFSRVYSSFCIFGSNIILMQWLKEEFLPYLEGWEASVYEHLGFSRTELKKMLLPPETLLGIRLSGRDELRTL